MALKREIKDAYIEGRASIYVKTHGDAVYVDENETETLTQRLDNVKDSITEHTSQLNAKVNKSSIVNNCSTTEEGFALDARQGKILLDIINSLNDVGTFIVALTAETPLEYTINFSKTMRGIPNLNLVLISSSISTYEYFYSIKNITPTKAVVSIKSNVTLDNAMFKYTATCM